MSKRFLMCLLTAAAVFADVPLRSAHAAGQGQIGRGGREARPAGPIPRTAEGEPDLTGVWDVHGIEDISQALVPGSEIVLTPYGAQRHQIVDAVNDPNAKCLPWGPTRMMCCTRHADGFIVHKDVIAILTESQQTFRLVYMDGRPLPSDLYRKDGTVDRFIGGWMGFSRGKWEGDTLVVDTVGMDDRTWIDGEGGHEHSDKMHLTERFELKDANTIVWTATIEDPVFFVKPWTAQKRFNRMVGDRIMSHSCVENERDLAHLKSTKIEETAAQEGRGRGAEAGRGRQ